MADEKKGNKCEMADEKKDCKCKYTETGQDVEKVFTVTGQDSENELAQEVGFSRTSDRQNMYGQSVSWHWTPLTEFEKFKGFTLVSIPVVFFVMALVLMAFYGPKE